jgi:pantoate--beta-alanine ligase
MIVSRTISGVRQALDARTSSGPAIFVPTMGALHEGHVSLFRAARSMGEGSVVASIFVNPAQFTDAADLAQYPRPEARDVDTAREAGVDVLFMPDAREIYPPAFATSMEMSGAADGFESDYRPGHFDGVATVCLKLFHIIRPAVVFLGQKDAQQVAVLRQLVRDLNLEIDIRVGPTVRDADGLAWSSRNARLSAAERAQAGAIPRALAAAVRAHRHRADPVAAARQALGALPIDYVDLATFTPEPTLVLAVRVGAIRLIDNVPLDRPDTAGISPEGAPGSGARLT